MNFTVLVVGSGVLAELVYKEVSLECEAIRVSSLKDGVNSAANLVLELDDAWHPTFTQQALEVQKKACIPWLRGFVMLGQGVIGPLVIPESPGCSHCADTRILYASANRQEMWQLHDQLANREGKGQDAWASRTGLLQVAHLIVEVVRQFKEGQQPLKDQVYMVHMNTLQMTRHFFLPSPSCPICGQLPDDTPEAAKILLQTNTDLEPGRYRTRSMDDLKEVLASDYLDDRTGLLNGKMHDLVSPFSSVMVNLPLFHANELSAGRTLSYAESELTGILEGLERYCGLEPRGKRTVVHDSYRHLADQALNPVIVGIHSSAEYADKEFPFQPFHPDLEMDWVWGYSFLQERPLLIPERLSYYSLGGEGGYVYETSNGCALGGSLEEAIFHGILEVVERDAFLLTWYALLPVPRLDPLSSGDLELTLMVKRLEAVTGYDLHLFNTTMDNGIPSVWIIAKNRNPTGINLVCSAGAHLDPVRAVKSAIHELAGSLLVLDEKFSREKERCKRMYHDSNLVKNMDDHLLLYSLTEAQERLEFLLDDSRKSHSFASEFSTSREASSLSRDLMGLIDVFKGLGMDVCVVNQTAPELERNNLHCVKVLIPGMLPMTFGHRFTRLTGLERVLKVPFELGYAAQPLTMEQLNPFPHPFP